MSKTLITTFLIFTFSPVFYNCSSIYGQGTKAEIIFTQQKEKQAREQLKRILTNYELDPWIITKEVRIRAGVDPHSHPILTLNTNFLDNDKEQLSVFVHEQAHWFVYKKPETEAAVKELQKIFPNSPNSADFRTFQHLIVGWLELDAMAELTNEEIGREIIKKKVRELISKPLSAVEKNYKWYNDRVLNDTKEIGEILAEHGLIITPDKGLKN